MFSVLQTTLVGKLASYTWTQWAAIAAILLLSLMVLEQLVFQLKRKNLPGPPWVVPFVGGIIHMVLHPFDFWHGQMAYGGLSWNSIIGKLIIMVCDDEKVRQVFKNCSEDMPLALHPNAYTLLGKDNIAFLNGHVHKTLRQQLLPLFTEKNLKMYIDLQVQCIRDYFVKWSEMSTKKGEMEMRPAIYDLNTYTSFSVFVGPYLNPELRKSLVNDYSDLTNAMLGFPLCVPGTLLWKGYKARPRLLANLETVVKASKSRMRDGNEPGCLLDVWMKNVVVAEDEAKAKHAPAPEHSTDLEIAKVVIDFLFASQDASTSSITFITHYMGIYPEVLQRVRDEIKQVHKTQQDVNKPFELTSEVLPHLRFTWQVCKELLRIRPPATIVPHIANTPVEMDGYTVPKGALIVPSIWSSNRVGFTNPETFDPDRFSEERGEDKKFEKQFMTFGAGPHACLGYRYAMNHIMCYLALLAHEVDFTRKHTSNMHEIIYLPTIYPADHCMLSSFKLRDWRAAVKA